MDKQNLGLLILLTCLISSCAQTNTKSLIKTEPKRIAEMDVSVNKEVECSYPGEKCLVGRVTYTFPKDKPDTVRDYMIVVSKNLVENKGFKFHKEGLAKLDLLLKSKDPKDLKTNYDFWPVPFDDCSEYACNIVKEYSGIKFPGADFVKTFASRDGQDIPGTLVSRILIKKGNDYFLLVGDVPLGKSGVEKKCDPLLKDTSNENKAFIDCYANEYQNNPELIANTKKTFERLINEFELK
jgi:hypothetical protein